MSPSSLPAHPRQLPSSPAPSCTPLGGDFCRRRNPLGTAQLYLLRKTNKHIFFSSSSVYYCIISFSCSRENVVSLLEDAERQFIKKDRRKVQSMKECPWDGESKGKDGCIFNSPSWDPPPTPVKPCSSGRKHGSAAKKPPTRSFSPPAPTLLWPHILCGHGAASWDLPALHVNLWVLLRAIL